MNDNYFLAISVRTTAKRYFLGAVVCAKDKVKYDLKLTEKRGLQFDCKYSKATVSKYGIFALPRKEDVKQWHKALRKYFGGKNALVVWVHNKLAKNFQGAGDVDRFEILIGEVK